MLYTFKSSSSLHYNVISKKNSYSFVRKKLIKIEWKRDKKVLLKFRKPKVNNTNSSVGALNHPTVKLTNNWQKRFSSFFSKSIGKSQEKNISNLPYKINIVFNTT